VRTFDIGLLPLPDDPFAAAKSPIKGLQYMASGVATIASPRAAVREMFAHGETARFASTMDEWAEAIVALVQVRDRRRKLSAAARKRFETSFSLLTQAPLVASRLTGRPGNAAGPHQPP
jgi:glycosyltransferase involved in cell wall biosynthesis